MPISTVNCIPSFFSTAHSHKYLRVIQAHLPGYLAVL
uniref:Uncharacterized protein n=1 Tax=Anguilla anguilla TaxID=7936 RepID=A0A0E9XDC2_ANGAN